MTVRLEINPEIEASLNAQAAAKGVSLDAYLREVIEDLAGAKAPSNTTVDEFRETLDKLAEMGRQLPNLTSASFHRERIYQDHD